MKRVIGRPAGSVRGQTLVEYLLLLGIISLLSVQAVKSVSRMMAEGVYELTSVLSTHLSVGVCKDNCFWSGYANGEEL